MPPNTRALEILDLTLVPGLSPPVYAVGIAASRITMADQQQRAVNLVWALLSEGRLKSGHSVAIVGGGVAGVTAAAYALSQHLRVAVFEKFGFPFALQHGSGRWIHPAIYDWPADGWNDDATHLPCMNWRAGVARDIVAALRDEWGKHVANPLLDWKPETEIVSIERSGASALLLDSATRRHGPFDCIVLATGFGEEAAHSAFDCRPYWRDDDLHQRLRSGGVALVSGCGDGGLIDAIRVALLDFRHDWLAEIASKAAEDRGFISALLGVEHDTASYPDGHELTDATLAIPAPDSVTAMLRAHIRPNTSVVLNANADGAFTRGACLLNRFVVAELMKLGVVTYSQGRVDLASVTRIGTRFDVSIAGTTTTADLIVVRHGPTISPLASFPSIKAALDPVRMFLRTYRAGVDRTRIRSWGLLPVVQTEPLAALPPLSADLMTYLGTLLRNAIKDELVRRNIEGAVVGFEPHERSIAFHVRFAQQEDGLHLILGSDSSATLSHTTGTEAIRVHLASDAMAQPGLAAQELIARVPEAVHWLLEAHL